jgi:hypothetical protein
MNQNPYRKRPVTAKQLLGETDTKPGNGLADIRFILDGLTAGKKAKEAGNG